MFREIVRTLISTLLLIVLPLLNYLYQVSHHLGRLLQCFYLKN